MSGDAGTPRRRAGTGARTSTKAGIWEPAPSPALVRAPTYPWLVVATTCVGAFIGQLDASIVQIALPTLERAFEARLGAVSWVAIAYQLAFASALPIFARLADMAGRKLMYLVGFALFAAASAACALAPDLPTLIAGRVLLGVAGAMLGANSIVVLVRSAGAERRATAMGIFAASQAIGVSLGPIAGGILLEAFGWRAVFWASVPFAAAAALAAWLVVPTSGEAARERFDLPGALLLVPALAALLMVISESYHWGPASFAFIACALIVPVFLAGFVARERRAVPPLVDLALFRSRAFAGGMVGVVVAYAILYAVLFLMSFALVRGYAETPLAAGLKLAIVPVAIGLVAPFSGRLAARFGLRPVLVAGMVLCAVAMLLLSEALFAADLRAVWRGAALALFGAGLGLFVAPNNDATLHAAPENRSGAAGGLLNLMRVIGSSVGVASASALLSWRIAAATGRGDTTVGVPGDVLLAAVRDGLALVVALAAIGAAAALLHRPPRTAASAASPETSR